MKNIWLKSLIDDQAESAFSFSLAGESFTSIGGSFKFGWGNWRGTRVGIYSYNNDRDDGYVDVAFFHYTFKLAHNKNKVHP